MPDFITAQRLHLQVQFACGNAPGAGDHSLERADHRTGNQPGRQHPHQQRQDGGQGNGHGIARQLSLHRLLLAGIGLVDPIRDLFGARLQLPLEPLLLGQQVGVFTQLLGETADVPGHLAQHALITRVVHRRLELLDQRRCLDCLRDTRLADARLALATLLQAHPRFVHGLQHQPRYLGDLRGLLKEFPALLPLGLLEGVTAVVGQTGLQHIKVVGDAGHRPTGHLQRHFLGLHRFDEGLERLAVGTQVGLDRGQCRQPARTLQQPLQTVAQSVGLFAVGAQGKALLMLAQTMQVGIELAQLAKFVETLTHPLQRRNADGRHRQGQQQHQGKSQAQFAGHAQVGQNTVPTRAHRRSPFTLSGFPKTKSGNGGAPLTRS
ncbi:hypothetical protein D3C79_466240 [compost metagenome]